MSYLDKSKKTAINTCKITANKTNKIVQRTRLKMYINECKSEIENAYNAIGKKVYEKHVREEDIDIKENLKDECKRIDKLSKEIEKSIEHILILKDMKKCPECFSEIMIQYNFCPNCGKKQHDIKSVGASSVRNTQENLPNDALSEEEYPDEKEAEIIKDENEDISQEEYDN